MQMMLHEICECLGLNKNLDNLPIANVVTDSREVKSGDLFIAIKGPNFDGHDFVQNAVDSGAVAVVASKNIEANVPMLLVEDTTVAYGQIANMHRTKFAIPVVAITGSCGKTTVQSMTANILRQVESTLSPAGSFNNEIGLPKTLLELNAEHKFAVLEMGAKREGDIKYLMDIVKPNITMVNNVSPAHTAMFGDVDTIARTKGEIYTELPVDGIAVINVDDVYAPFWLNNLKGQRVISYGLEHKADITCSYIVEEHHRIKIELATDIGNIEVILPLLGMHNVMNALAATAMARALDIPLTAIKQGLESFKTVTRRMEIKQAKNGAKIIDDSYNANPKAMHYAVEVLSKQQGNKIMVIGDMLELGNISIDEHKLLGQKAKRAGINRILAFGEYAMYVANEFGEDAKHYTSKDDLIAALKDILDTNTVVLVKGSNDMRMNEVVNALL